MIFASSSDKATMKRLLEGLIKKAEKAKDSVDGDLFNGEEETGYATGYLDALKKVYETLL
jgi:hypothetical protein